MSEKMICPLLFDRRLAGDYYNLKCMKEQCAWWVNDLDGCAMICLVNDLQGAILAGKEVNHD